MTTDAALLRLRAANPFSETHRRDEELFARITSAPREAPVRRTIRRPVLVVALALIAVAALASTAFAISQWISGDVVKPDVTKAEYRAAQQELAVPPGFKWPVLHVPPNSVTTRGGGGAYAVMNAEVAWDCYWVDAIRRGDVQAQTDAQTAVTGLMRSNMIVAPLGAPEDWVPANPPRRPYVAFAHDGGYEWLQQTYALAAAGHPQRLVQRCKANS